jgi:hypothetical protein
MIRNTLLLLLLTLAGGCASGSSAGDDIQHAPTEQAELNQQLEEMAK